jgi:hypothetical protein
MLSLAVKVFERVPDRALATRLLRRLTIPDRHAAVPNGGPAMVAVLVRLGYLSSWPRWRSQSREGRHRMRYGSRAAGGEAAFDERGRACAVAASESVIAISGRSPAYGGSEAAHGSGPQPAPCARSLMGGHDPRPNGRTRRPIPAVEVRPVNLWPSSQTIVGGSRWFWVMRSSARSPHRLNASGAATVRPIPALPICYLG